LKNDFRIAINQVCNQRSLPKEVIIEAIEAALVSAYKKDFGANQSIRVRLDPDSGKARVFVVREIVSQVEDPETQISIVDARKVDAMAEIGGAIEQETTPNDFGRIAAQTAKQVVLQRIREAERDLLYNQFVERAGEIINGTVRNVDERGNVIISLGKVEAILPRSERIRTESYQPGQRLRAFVTEVQKTSRGPQIVVSRTHRQFLKRLLELEVPEIFNGTVEIKAIAREPGARSKVAVVALQEGIDPVGSCVGVRGVRIQNVVTELGGEKIDVVNWDASPALFVANALSPAKVAEVIITEATNTATVIVPDSQLSLAIGKEGQNARLAAKLTSWRIDIKSESEAAVDAEERAQAAALAAEEAAKRDAARAQAIALLEEAESLIAAEGEGAAAVAEVSAEAEAEPAVEAAPVAMEPEAAAEPEVAAEAAVVVEPEAAVEVEAAEPEPAAEAEPVAEAELLDEIGEVAAATEPEPAAAEAPAPEGTFVAGDEEVEDEEFERQEKLSKKQRRQKRWQYVLDENSGNVVAQRKRRPSRTGKGWDTEWTEE